MRNQVGISCKCAAALNELILEFTCEALAADTPDYSLDEGVLPGASQNQAGAWQAGVREAHRVDQLLGK